MDTVIESKYTQSTSSTSQIMDQVIKAPAPSSEMEVETLHISLPWTWRPVKRRMLTGCDFFRDGDKVMQISRKLIPLEDGEEEKEEEARRSAENRGDTIPCCVTGCTQTFISLLSYENHYKSIHCNRCHGCHRSFPSVFLLDLHIEESHDPFFALHPNTQYRCLVESCEVRFPNSEDRRRHVIRTHHYPPNFRFHNLSTSDRQRHPKNKKKASKGDDIDDKTTRSHDSPSSHSDKENTAVVMADPEEEEERREGGIGGGGVVKGEEEDGMEVEEKKEEKVVPVCTRRVFVPKVPRNFSFGHGVGRGFQHPPAGKKNGKKKGKGGRWWHQQGAGNDDGGDGGAGGERSSSTTTTNIENVDMKDMAQALSEAL